jgi:putative ABC transport system permease protein
MDYRGRSGYFFRKMAAEADLSGTSTTSHLNTKGGRMLERLVADVIDALRALKADALIVTAAVVTLAASIAINVAMFGLIDRALVSPPPHIARPDRLFSLTFQAPGQSEGEAGMTTTSYVAYRTLRDQVSSFAAVAAWQHGPNSVTIDAEQAPAETILVSSNYFEVLGAALRIGRGIASSDEREGIAAAVLSDAFWRTAFHSDPSVIGRRFTASGIEYTVAGVMPRGFSGHSAASVDIWLPVETAMRADPGWNQNPFRNVVSVVTRLADSADVVTASAQAASALSRGVMLKNVVGEAVGAPERRIAFWLAGVSLLVLAIGLANASTLLLVRGERRRREAVIRSALGASRGRLWSHIAIQSLVIAAVATVIACVLGYWLDEAIRRVLLPDLAESGGLRARTMLAAAAAGMIGAVMALAAAGSTLPGSEEMHVLHRRTRSGGHATLLVVQTAVCVALLAGTGMFARSLYGLLRQDFGMQMDKVLVVEFEQGPGAASTRDSIVDDALDRVRALPGVQAATTFQTLPFGAHHIPPISVPGRAEPPSVGGQLPFLIAATPEFFDILGIEILQGRKFTSDDARNEPVVIVNETMARGTWPSETAVGKCIRIGFDPSFDPFTAAGPPTPSDKVPCRRVIGVAKDVRQRSVVPIENEGGLMQYYVPPAQTPGPPAGLGGKPGSSGLLVRTVNAPSRLANSIRTAVVHGSHDLPYLHVDPYAQMLERQVHPWRLGVTLLAMFSLLAMAVAALGLYAAFAHAVAIRIREMAVRIAIGASPAKVARMILLDASRLATIGIAVGALGASLGGRSLQSILFGFVPGDPVVLATAGAAMLFVVLAATWLPARRASRVEPSVLLRAE